MLIAMPPLRGIRVNEAPLIAGHARFKRRKITLLITGRKMRVQGVSGKWANTFPGLLSALFFLPH